MTTPIQETWQEELYRLDIGDPDSKGCTITLGEYLRIDCPELENFILTLLQRKERETIKRVMEVRPDFNNQKEIDWKCPSCGRYGEEGEYCPSDRRKLVKEEREYPDEQDEAHNQALQEWTDSITKLNKPL